MYYFILFLTFFSLFGCHKKDMSDTSYPWDDCSQRMGDNACNFTLQDQDGQNVSLYDFYGQPIVIDFSTGWCGFCGIAAREVQSVQDKYASHDLVYITIMIEDHRGWKPDPEFCQEWATAFGIYSAPVLAGSNSLLDPEGESGWPVAAYPAFYFIDSDMIIQGNVLGFDPWKIDEVINTLF